jgi:hypothetical protein
MVVDLTDETAVQLAGLNDRLSPLVVVGNTIFIKEEVLRDERYSDEFVKNMLAHELSHTGWDTARTIVAANLVKSGKITQAQFMGLMVLLEVSADRKAVQMLSDLEAKSASIHTQTYLNIFPQFEEMNLMKPEYASLREKQAREFYSQLPKTKAPAIAAARD